MEAIFLILIGAALFSQSWFILGLYSEGRTMGVFVGGLALLSLATIMFAPMVLTGEDVSPTADYLAEITIMKSLIIVWALYTVAVAGTRAVGLRRASNRLLLRFPRGCDTSPVPLLCERTATRRNPIQ